MAVNNFTILFDNTNNIAIFNYSKLVDNTKSIANLNINIDNFTDEIKKYLYINSLPIQNQTNFIVEKNNTENDLIFVFKMLKPIKETLTFENIITINDDCEINLQFSKQQALINTLYNNSANIINNNLSSFMLIRTNPKLTGNIKLVVDTNYNLYLDTFKTCELLNRKEYRHQLISSEGNYPKDVYNIFKSVPKGVIYNLPDGTYDPHKTHSDFDDQFQTLYEYGAETNNDLLYTENMRLLAPLWINKEVPDYFVIFKINDPYNTFTYNNKSISNTDLFKSLISDSEIIQYYDLRKSSAIGQYLTNYQNMISDNVGITFLQFVEQEYKNVNNNIDFITQGNNSWYGISLDRGILTKKSETSWFSNQILEQKDKVQEDFNMFLINGFERQNMVIPNLLNLEFMFNDTDASVYSMHRYFGLYLKENDFLKYQYIKQNNKTLNPTIEKLDASGNIVDETNLKTILNSSNYSDRLFFATTTKNEKRIKDLKDLNNFIYQNVLNKPEKNIVNLDATNIKLDSLDKHSFISIKFTEQIKYGEHFRLIYKDKFDQKNNLHNNIIFEIIASNDKRLKYTKDNIFPYIQTNRKQFEINDIYGSYFRSKTNLTSDNIPYTFDTNLYHYNNLNSNLSDVENIKDYPLLHDGKIATSMKLKVFDVFNVSDNIPYSTDVDNRYFNNYNKLATEVNLNKYPYISNSYFGGDDELNYFNFPYIYRLTFYTQDLNDDTKLADLETQIKRIKSCIQKFDQNFYVSYSDSSSLCIISDYDNMFFQHVSSDTFNESLEDEKIINSIDYNSTKYQDTLIYFTNQLKTNLHLTNYKTLLYDKNTQPFALIDFELLKWKMSNIVKFINFPKKDNFYLYELSKNIIDNNISEKVMICSSYKSVNKFEQLFDFDIQYGFVNIDETEKQNDQFIEENYLSNVVYSPYDINKTLIYSNKELNTLNNKLKLYLPMACNISLMGILNIKDIDSRINYNYVQNINSNNFIQFEKGETIDISETSEKLKQLTLYHLISGKFNEVGITPNSNFYINNNKFYFNNNYQELNSLTVLETVKIELANKNNLLTYSYSNKNSILNELNYFKDKTNINESKLDIPLTIPINFRWKSNGVYFDHFSELDQRFLDASYVSKNNNGFYIENNIGVDSNENQGQYIINDFYDSISIDGSLYTFKELILENTNVIKNPIHEYLILNKNLDTAIGYYNKYVNTLEFIYYGIKFSFQMTSSEYVNTIRLNEYNNYEVIMINDYHPTQKNEIIISITEKIILIIIHTFNKFKLNSLSNIITVDENKNYNNSLNYVWEDSTFNLDYSKCYGSDEKLIIPKKIIINKNNFSEGDQHIEFDYHDVNSEYSDDENNLYSYFKFVNNKTYKDTDNFSILLGYNYFTSTGTNYLMIQNNINSNIVNDFDNISNVIQYENRFLTLSSYILKDYIQEESGHTISDFKENINENSYNNEIYIIKENNIIEHINVSEEYAPLKIVTNSPIQIKYDFGYFNPVTYDIFDFSIRDDKELSSLTNMNLLLSNTKLNNILNIENYYGLKIDSNKKKTEYIQNYFVTTRNIFSSNWDKNYYRSYTNSENTYNDVNGYIPGVEDKAFFGSKCLILPKETYFIIKNFKSNIDNIIKSSFINNSYTGSTFNNNENKRTNKPILSITINISKAILNYFKQEQPTFIKNWNNFGYNNDTAINNYINQTLTNYFAINDKIEFHLYQKDYGKVQNERVELIIPDDFEKNWNITTLSNNIETEFYKDNEDLILTIRLTNVIFNSTLKFYPQIKINRL